MRRAHGLRSGWAVGSGTGRCVGSCVGDGNGMAHSLSAKKRVRQNAKHRAVNRWRLRTMREALKEFLVAVAAGDQAKATETFRAASKIIDRTAQKGVIHANQAARRKSRMAAKVKALASAKA